MVKTNRDEILETAATMFADRGYDKMDVQKLADQLKIGKGTVYRHFYSKEELFLASANHVIHTLIPETEKAMQSHADPLKKIQVAIQTILSFFETHPEYAELLIQDRAIFKERQDHTFFQYKKEVMAHWKLFFERLIAEKILRPIASEKVLQVFLAFIYGALYVRFFTANQYSLSQLAEDGIDILFRGILIEKSQ
jgi:AcrR family transcriptional regulator